MATAKIILNMDVPGLGSSGDVVTVARGYARNYLVPRKWRTLGLRAPKSRSMK